MWSGDAIEIECTVKFVRDACVSDYDEDELDFKNNILAGIRRHEEEVLANDRTELIDALSQALYDDDGSVEVAVKVRRV